MHAKVNYLLAPPLFCLEKANNTEIQLWSWNIADLELPVPGSDLH